MMRLWVFTPDDKAAARIFASWADSRAPQLTPNVLANDND